MYSKYLGGSVVAYGLTCSQACFILELHWLFMLAYLITTNRQENKKKVVSLCKQVPKKVFKPDPNPKNSPEGPKKSKKAQNLAGLKTKKIGLYFQNENW